MAPGVHDAHGLLLRPSRQMDESSAIAGRLGSKPELRKGQVLRGKGASPDLSMVFPVLGDELQ